LKSDEYRLNIPTTRRKAATKPASWPLANHDTESRFISQPRRMIALGCASEIALAAASNSASCAPLATSARAVPFTDSGTDQTTFRFGFSFFQMPGTQLNRTKSSQVVWA